MNNIELSNLLFPSIDKNTDYYENIYPARNLQKNAKVTRLGPSPTGFIHLGNLYGAFIDERLAHQSNGIFYLRIEDTDDKRYIEGAIETIIDSLSFFGIEFDEGVTKNGDVGNYGSYTQSKRIQIYKCFAKRLIAEGKAYPCFLKEEEIAKIRTNQEENKMTPGIYYGWSKFRDFETNEDIQKEVVENINKGLPYVIRLKSSGKPNALGDNIKRNKVYDAIRGEMGVPENFQDIVILKKNGIPTYHFAHVIDDHLMRTTHVVRGAEWLPSLPIHVELFDKLNWNPPIYCHTAQLMKIGEDGTKRKLSKRKDPELSLDYYKQEGYHPYAVREYLLTLLNSNYEEWRMENPNISIDKFDFTTKKMSTSGALFDLNKLNDVSKETLLKISAKDLFDFLKNWSEHFAPKYEICFNDRTYLEQILDIGKDDKKPRKDFINAKQTMDFISYFFDDFFKIEDDMPVEASKGDISKILSEYLGTYNHNDDQSEWFGKIREIAVANGYAAKPKDYKKHPEEYKGHVGHVSTVIRIALTGRSQSPDIWAIQQILGETKVKKRINKLI
ncbi:MAG TPA: glutamate--tRNA ligase [Anaerovoracaceae bacterium]|nr:glutamate--tRNA ligase [Anaerovoracaceae bacterium]